jgi:CubicO group peptidase (beta-lactamase class C family)
MLTSWVDAAGVMDLETKVRMKRDSLFRMASMTRPVIGMAMMMMIEEGKVSLSGGRDFRLAPEADG